MPGQILFGLLFYMNNKVFCSNIFKLLIFSHIIIASHKYFYFCFN